jgi:hypothetical protein
MRVGQFVPPYLQRPSVWGFQMSTYQPRLTAAPELLSVLVHDVANLNLQLCELNRLRDQVRKAQLLARKSPQPKRRNGHGAISRSSSEIDRESAFGRY